MTSKIGFKGFTKDLKGINFQFKVGKEYQTNGLKICTLGFHYCEHAVDVLNYYNGPSSRYAIVEILGDVQTIGDKSATNHIKVVREIPYDEFLSKYCTGTVIRKTGKFTYLNGRLHSSNDEPSIMYNNGTRYWHEDGLKHRAWGRPAVIFNTGEECYYHHDKIYKPQN